VQRVKVESVDKKVPRYRYYCFM